MTTLTMPFLINETDVRSNNTNVKDDIALLKENIRN